MSRSALPRAYMASLGLVAVTVGVWLVAYATGTIYTMTMPWDSLIYGAVIVSLVLGAITAALAVASSSAGRWRAFAVAPALAVTFLWWVLVFYGQASVGLGGGNSRDVIAEFASQPTYVPVMSVLTLLIGLPLVIPWVRAHSTTKARSNPSIRS